jgi:type IV pilus assembly protein PilV
MNRRLQRAQQSGVILLEALIGVLIFSLGVLALVAMQSVSISNVSNARYRVEAAFLANQILSQAWIDRGVGGGNLATYQFPGGGSPAVTSWVAQVNALMPQAAAYPPTIQVVAIPGVAGGQQLSVVVRWKAPDALLPSNQTAIGYISDP